VLGWLRDDMVRTMSLIGAGSVADLDRSLLTLPG
jgi:isopentenyl diphosphate isomerase/L-lactate dehydrogenase-like FMN-dependent dehydrogenase